jgi:hypothetical protein
MAFRTPTKANSLWLHPLLRIVLLPPNGFLETGLRMWPAEKSEYSDPVLSAAVRSLQSGLLRYYREKWAPFAHFRGKNRGISL